MISLKSSKLYFSFLFHIYFYHIFLIKSITFLGGIPSSIKASVLSKSKQQQVQELYNKYVSNFALNRYCNLKVTDNTLYHAKKVGFYNDLMYIDFWTEILALLPAPILDFFGVHYDKDDRYSRGDKLKALSENRHPFCSYLVTSHLADGLLTFGFWYFPIEFLMFFVFIIIVVSLLTYLNYDKIFNYFTLHD